MSFAILTGIADRMAASFLPAIVSSPRVVEAILGRHRIFGCGEPAWTGRFWDFLKESAPRRGFLAWRSPSGERLSQFLGHPLPSSHPYSLSARSGAR